MQFQQKSVKAFCENHLAVGNLWERLLHTWLIVNYVLQILAGVKHVLNVCTRMQPLPSAPGSWLASTWQHTRAGNHCRQGGQKDQGVWPGCFNMRSQEEELREEMKDRGQGSGMGVGDRGNRVAPAPCATKGEEWAEWCALWRRVGSGPGGSSEFW